MNTESKQRLMEYGRLLMARLAGEETAEDPPWAGAYLDLLARERPAAVPGGPLQSIFTLVDVASQRVAPLYVPAAPLGLTEGGGPDRRWVSMPVSLGEAAAGRRSDLYAAFRAAGGETEQNFDRFFHLMRKYASTLPNTYGEPGVSLFEQWKMVVALAAISGDLSRPPSRLGLVSGDIPGIQRTINLVTSKGAAKAMRGRSAFIQLLGHALVERLLHELRLGPANVIYDAGGNFVLLTGWDDGEPSEVEETVGRVASQVNHVLLAGTGTDAGRFDGFHGDLAVALAAVEMPLDALRADLPPVELPDGKLVSRWQRAEKRVKDAVAAAKARPFGDLAQADDEGWQALFAPEPSETDDFCAVCRRQRDADEDFDALDSDAPEDLAIRSNRICPECRSFGVLATDLGRKGARLLLTGKPPREVSAWQCALYSVAGWWYRIGTDAQTGDVTLALDLDDFPAPDLDGFRLLARTTPLTAAGQIKPNDVLAAASEGGLVRLGVLRMDVDGLGALLVHGLPRRTPMQTAELSQALERFFAGWLDRICGRVDGGKGLFYVLFAGGDDLFVIGPWTFMPKLAQAVQGDFRRYTGEHAAIHLSAGIAVVGEKAPLYAAAGESHEALETAKRLDRDTQREKDAITFLGRIYHWNDFKTVNILRDDIVNLVKDKGLPKSLLTTLLAIERRYRRDLERGPDGEPLRNTLGPRETVDGRVVQVYFGPWMWRQAYALARLGEAHPGAKGELGALKDTLLDGRIEDLGLAARWAQWLTREEK